jgi:GDP-L-fucose synthase
MAKQKILILGKRGLVGSNATNYFSRSSQYEVTALERKDLDLRNQKLVTEYFSLSRPQIVLLTAANVGGIKYNIENPSTQLIDNLQISTNVIQASLDYGVEKLINFGSNCMYPSGINYPMDENLLQTGPTESTNRSYSAYKLATWEMVNAVNIQFKKNWLTVIPATIYGPHDNFSLSKGHVIPSLMRKFHDAKLNSNNSISLWGDGSPKREFLFIDDLLNALSLILHKNLISHTLNIGSGYETSIKDLALEISELVGFNGKINWDLNSANGATRKILNSNYINSLGWKAETKFSIGLERTYNWFKYNYESARL